MTIDYKIPQTEDAEKIYQMMVALDEETSYMLYEVGERKPNLSMITGAISAAQENKSFFMLAKVEGEVVGYLVAQRQGLSRVAHTAYIVIGIRKAYQGQGIGTRLFQELEQWAKEQKLVRLELTVVKENVNAVKLYEKSGFHREGIREKSMFVQGRFLDELYMAKIFSQPN